MDIWKVSNLTPPPTITATSNIKEVDVKLLKKVLKKGIDRLHTKMNLLSTVIFQMKWKFRSSKNLKGCQKIHRSLRVCLKIQISEVLQSFLDLLPQVYKENSSYLPTRNMIEFVLVRIQRLGTILVRMHEGCERSFILTGRKLRPGQWRSVVPFYGMLTRIFMITKFLIKSTCKLYTNLLPFSSKLTSCGKHWLPARYVFPESLNEWLDIDWVDLETNVVEIPDGDDDEIIMMSNDKWTDDSDDDLEVSDEHINGKDDESLTINNNKSEDGNVIEVTENNSSLCEEDIINLNEMDIPQILSPLKTVNQNIVTKDELVEFGENVDVGEILNMSDSETSLLKSEKSKGKKRGREQKVSQPINQTIQITISDIETPQIKKRKLEDRPSNQFL